VLADVYRDDLPDPADMTRFESETILIRRPPSIANV
jgi:hypothetical protein